MPATTTTIPGGDSNKPPLALFLDSVVPENRHIFLQPPSSLPTGSLLLAKETLDALAGLVGDTQAERFKALMGKKRKREAGYDRSAVLKIRKVHVDGFETGQVWQQAKKIIGCALEESDLLLEELLEEGEVSEEGGENGELKENGVKGVKMVRFDEDGFEVDSEDEDEEEDGESESGSEGDSEETDGESGEEDVSDEEEVDGEMFDEEEDGEEVDVEDEEDQGEEEEEDEEVSDEFEEDPDGLNDGFFSLKKFNKQTQWFEAQDARADPNTDANSDDESIDWHSDPFGAPKMKKAKGPMDDEDDSDVDMDGQEFDEEEEDEEEEVEDPRPSKQAQKGKKGKDDDLQEEDDGDDLGLGEMGLGDTDMDLTANDIYYKDFFAPPPKKGKRGGKKKEFKFSSQAPKPDEVDYERAERDVRRDLFDDDSEREDSEDALSDVSAGDPKSRRSAHERRQAKIAEEIRKLESELVAKRAWTLSGEASAVDRPMNSLLEEDLDFEHVGKPVPVITEEVSESIEALIKRRILAQEFDELIRRRPDTLGDPNRARRGLVEIEDTKGKQSLAEIYEEEHAKKADPDAYVSQSDEKLRKDEDEIKAMWKDISAKLDALSSWQYKPKPAAPTLTVVADVATVAMEDAQPTTAQGVSGGESMIAPQEVYAPGKEGAEKGEVVAKSGLPIARQEMSREDKIRRRRREKERIRKAGGVDANKPMSRGTQARKETMNELKKGSVKVINRKGETVGLDGKKVVEQTGATSSSRFKL